MNYIRSKKYETEGLLSMMMGPNPVKLCEELVQSAETILAGTSDASVQWLFGKGGAVVCDLGSGQGLTSVFMAKEYGWRVYACDLWSEPEEHLAFFRDMGLTEDRITPVKGDATTGLPFPENTFDAVVSVDAYHYFGRDGAFLDRCLLPYVKPGGVVLIAIPGMKRDCHRNLPPELLLSWTAEDLTTMHDVPFWQGIAAQSRGFDVVEVSEMESMDEVWEDWLRQENPYAVGDRKTMYAGGGKYLNFIQILLKKK